MKMKEVRPVRSKSYLKHKLISAGAMLLVSAIMMVSSSYAWYVLSTAPEVSNIKTQVGANGALEIALLNEESWTDLSMLDMGDIDESLTNPDLASALTANLTWGNLVNLDDAAYGLDKIILNPARLYIEQDGDDYKVNSVMLKTPIYGEDGRVQGLDKEKAVAWTYRDGSFSNPDGYGVRAVGTSASMSVFQLGMNSARSALVTYSSAARTAASNILQATGGNLAGIVVDYAVSSKTEGFTKSDVQSVLELAYGLQNALVEIETALRQVFAGYITTTAAVADGITSENYAIKLAEINDPTITFTALMAAYPGIADVVPGISAYIDKYTADETNVENAIASCEAMINGEATSFSWSQLAAIIYPLVDTEAMQVNGKDIETLKNELIGENGAINFDGALALVTGGLTISVPSGSGILSNIADFAGDYKANVPVSVNTTIAGSALQADVDVLMTTVGTTPSHLTASSNALKVATVAEASGSNSITDYYGYAIDLAFRTNAVESNLLLQTEGANRIYDGDTQNPTLQGGGSYMSFSTSAGLSATKMVKLMRGIRVVLAEPQADGTMRILAIAALDCTLGKDVYTELDDETKTETGMYAYLDGSAGAYQNSDLINADTYNALPDTSNVIFDPITGKVTAKLYIYSFEMTKSTTTDASGNVVDRLDEDGKNLYTGGLTLKSKVADGVITALTQDVVQKLTALVYLDGSVVNNSTVAANSMHSMTGTLNLQFSSSAELLPADNTQLRTDTSGVSYTELSGEVYESGYLGYAGKLGKIKDGYSIYTGTNEKLYFRETANEQAPYTELTMTNIANVIEEVTLTVTPNPEVSLAVDETVEMTLTLSDESLRDKVTGGGRAVNVGSITASGVDDGYFSYTITGTNAGPSYFEAHVTIEIGSEKFEIKSNRVNVTVTEAAVGS